MAAALNGDERYIVGLVSAYEVGYAGADFDNEIYDLQSTDPHLPIAVCATGDEARRIVALLNTPRLPLVTQCALCYGYEPCIDDGEAYICADRARCDARQWRQAAERAVIMTAKAENDASAAYHRQPTYERFMVSRDALYELRAAVAQLRELEKTDAVPV